MPFPSYISTRSSSESFSLIDAINLGLAPDGGLFVPDHIPVIYSADHSAETHQKSNRGASSCEASSYAACAAAVLTPFLRGELNQDQIRTLCEDAFSFEVPLVKLKGGAWDGCFVLELFHGPTLSFKDFGARMMGRLLGAFQKHGAGTLVIEKKTIVLVATSGDTGSAVADGLSGIKNVEVIILYPSGQVSDLQERQLIVKREGVTACRVDGVFDDCQRLVKGAFADPTLSSLRITSANSINMGRLLPQMTYYFWAAGRLETPPLFCVPSGNLGNLTAGMMARMAGMSAQHFLAAHNANRFFPNFLRSGDTSPRSSIQTISSAMDVGAPSNFERLQHLFSGEQLTELITGLSVSDRETRQAMTEIFRHTGYIADPHTAVGLESARRFREHTDSDAPVVVLSTAHPAKFTDEVEGATGQRVSVPYQLKQLLDREVRVLPIQNSQEDLASVILSVAEPS